MYYAIKHLHVTFVVLSAAGFLLRGLWMMQGSAHLRQRVVRVLPHVIDTGLLSSAIALAVMLGLNPLEHAWLAAKIAGLLLYIGLGTVALKRGRTRTVRIGAFVGALAVYGWIVSVALTKNAAGYLA